MSTADLFLVSSRMHRYLIRGSKFRALAIAANSPEYGFCSDLMPSVDEMVSILGSLCALGREIGFLFCKLFSKTSKLTDMLDTVWIITCVGTFNLRRRYFLTRIQILSLSENVAYN